MYPNPQDALPLTPPPDIRRFETQAEELLAARHSTPAEAIREWAVRCIETAGGRGHKLVEQLEQFARETLVNATLPNARFVVARAHGFVSWNDFADHIHALEQPNSPVAAFEAAADAVVSGDKNKLERLLRAHPQLAQARSTREHQATLLHYVSANGVENYRQVSPRNIAEITELLLDAGAEVDAEANVYGGGCTALGLVATSTPPNVAGVQRDVMDVLLKHGARIDRPGSAGSKHLLVYACLANGQPEAAAYLVTRGAALDLPGAAGLGRLDRVKTFFDGPAPANLPAAFSLACAYGQASVLEFLLEHGMDVNAPLDGPNDERTGLHIAAYFGHPEAVRVLLRYGATVDPVDKTWGTTPLIWALTGWTEKRAERYYEVVAQLVAASAHVKPDLLEWEQARADPRMQAALRGGFNAG